MYGIVLCRDLGYDGDGGVVTGRLMKLSLVPDQKPGISLFRLHFLDLISSIPSLFKPSEYRLAKN